jgi:hypothetical protein
VKGSEIADAKLQKFLELSKEVHLQDEKISELERDLNGIRKRAHIHL